MMRLSPLLPSLLALVFAAPLGAQRVTPSLDVSAGFGTGLGGRFEARGGMALDALAGIRLRPATRGSIVVALAAGFQGPLGNTDDCVPLPAGGCVQDFPIFYSASALVGWESISSRGPSLRVMVGPGYYEADAGRGTFGLQARLDAATAPLLHVALVASLRGAVLPDFRGDVLGVEAIGLGLRLR